MVELGEVLHEIVMDTDKFVPALIAGSIVIAITVKSVASIFTNASRERTRREIAAFVAEGSMTPEQGERLMNSGARRSC